jgi:Fic family protein
MLLEKIFEPVAHVQQLADDTLESYKKLVSVFKFINLTNEQVDHEQLNAALNRVHYTTALEGIDYHFEYVKAIVSNKRQPLERFEKEIYGYHQAEIFLYNRLGQPFDVYMINDMQRIFFAYPQNNTNDLFTAGIFEERGVDLAALFESGIGSFMSFLETDETYDPLTQSWMLHFFVLMRGPFGSTNPKIARLLQFYWLLKNNLTLGGLLHFEKELYSRRVAYQQLIAKAADAGKILKEQEQIDMTEYINFGLEVYAAHLNTIKATLKEYYKREACFEKLPPRHKNVVNYVFENGCNLFFNNQFGLNERQAELMHIMYRRGVLQTKELFDKFEVNRKTLQRDFNELAALGLVRIIGEGRGLKYLLQLSPPLPEKMQKYQAKFLAL